MYTSWEKGPFDHVKTTPNSPCYTIFMQLLSSWFYITSGQQKAVWCEGSDTIPGAGPWEGAPVGDTAAGRWRPRGPPHCPAAAASRPSTRLWALFSKGETHFVVCGKVGKTHAQPHNPLCPVAHPTYSNQKSPKSRQNQEKKTASPLSCRDGLTRPIAPPTPPPSLSRGSRDQNPPTLDVDAGTKRMHGHVRQPRLTGLKLPAQGVGLGMAGREAGDGPEPGRGRAPPPSPGEGNTTSQLGQKRC